MVIKKFQNLNLRLFVVWGVALLGISLNLLNVNSHYVWGDEGFSINLVRGSVKDILYRTAADVHPPLYYLILKFFSELLGHTQAVYVLVSLIPMTIGILYAVKYLTRFFGATVSVVFILLQSFSECALTFNVEIRMYSWSLLFVTLCALSAYSLLKENNIYGWMKLTIFGLFAAYTHYYALISVAFIFLGLFIMLVSVNMSNLKKCIICSFCVIVLYLPWIGILLNTFGRVKDKFWINDIPTIRECLSFLFGGTIWNKLVFIFFAISLAILLIMIIRRQTASISTEVKLIILCCITVVGTVIVGEIVSYLVKPIFLTRYLYPCAGLVWLAIGLTVTKVYKNKMVNKILIVVIFISILLPFNNYRKVTTNLKLETDRTIDFMNTQVNHDDLIVTNITHFMWTVFEYYFPEHKNIVNSSEEERWMNFNGTTWIFMNHEIDQELISKLEDKSKIIEAIDSPISLSGYRFHLYKVTQGNL